MTRFKYFKQQDQNDCGPTCLKMICCSYGRNVSIQKLRQLCFTTRGGTTLLDISEAAEKIGFRTTGVRLSLDQLEDVNLPCILHWRRKHFVILYKIKKGKFHIADPSSGLVTLTQDQFLKNWYGNKQMHSGITLLLTPTPHFYDFDEAVYSQSNWLSIIKYFYVYKGLFLQLVLGLIAGTILSLITPFFTQIMVDAGINSRNIDVVVLVLLAQIMLFIGSITINFIRSWILLHISSRINIAILTDFLIKLMKLPLSFFETKTTGDIMQRMNDQRNIEKFLTGTALTTIFSIINLVIFTAILIHYSSTIFIVSLGATILYFGWIFLFLKKRRELNYKQFDNSSTNQTTMIELVRGMPDIKLNNAEKFKRWNWEQIQIKLFKFQIKTLTLSQYQQFGSSLINQAKNTLITFISVTAVIKGDLTLGGMMAIQYIVGQVSSPIEQFLNFIQAFQDAKISLERLNEIHHLEDEEPLTKSWITTIPEDHSITVKNLVFRYPGAGNEPVLRNLNLHIPSGKTTAIVGVSGSGKTTILKLLLRMFEAEQGEIRIGEKRLNQISFKLWRDKCGAVTQDGYIFADTIAGNIAVGDEFPDDSKLEKAIQIANLDSFIDNQPFGLLTRIGSTGSGISQGQKQRLLIARAVYKDPAFLLFDEATNALDANNERAIVAKMNEFCKGKTVVVVAHRLSTVMNADNIIVLNKGKIVEQGTHQALSALRGQYFELVRNQLELGLN